MGEKDFIPSVPLKITMEEYFNRDKRRIKAILNLKKLKRDKPGATLSVDAVIEKLRRIGEGERKNENHILASAKFQGGARFHP